MKRLLALMLVGMLAACSTSGEQGQPAPQPESVTGTVPDYDGGFTHLHAALSFSATSEGRNIAFPTFTVPVQADATFSLQLTPLDLSGRPIGPMCGGNSPDGRGWSFSHFYGTNTPDSDEWQEEHGVYRLGGPNWEVVWLFSEWDFKFRGDCDGEDVILDLRSGWNTTVRTWNAARDGTRWVSGPIPATAEWVRDR